MATTNLYNSISGLLEISEKLNTKLTSFIATGAYKPTLANGSTSGLVYGGGDVTIAAGQITITSGKVDTAKIADTAVTSAKIGGSAVTTAKIADKNVTSGKLADDVNTKIGHGETAYGKVSGSTGTWHSHTNKTVLDGISSTNVSNWNDANTKKHTHANLAQLSGITADKITAWDNGAKISGVTLEKLSTATTGYAATYQLKVNGEAVGSKIDIVKDQFLKSGSLVKGTWSTGTTPGFTPSTSGTDYALALELYVRSDGGAGTATTTTVYIDVRNLVDVYTGENGVKVDGYKISLSGIPSNLSITSSQLPTIPSSKLADASKYQTAVNQAANWSTASGNVVSSSVNLATDHIVLGNNNNKTVKSSDYTVVSASASFGANTLATAPAITGYIAAQGFQKSADMGSFVTTSETSLEDDTIILGAGEKGVKNGVKIVSTSGDIAATSGATMVPTAAAVSSYVASKTASMVTGSSLKAGNLIIGNNNGAVKDSGIASGNVVTNTTGNASAAECIIVAAGASKAVKATAYTINTTTTSGGITNTANQIPNVQAVKAYTDAQDTAAKNYLLNGNTSTSTGVSDWGGAATAKGSLAYLNAQISDLLTRVSA